MQALIKIWNIMKNTVYGIILAALAASLSLASCSKEIEADPDNGGTPAAEGVREFTLSFAASVKSEPGTGDDWYNPVFTEGDVIKVSNNTTSENCTVTVSGGVAKIKTTLAGTLTAVYPSTAAVLTTGHITGITVPAAQDGSFAKANICMAENIAVGATSITFVNKTALFKVTPPSGVTEFTVTSLKAVVDGVARTGAAVPINSSEVVLENKVITVSNTTLTDFYVSLLPGAKLSDLSFEYTVTGQTYDGAMKGIPEKDIQTQATAKGKTKDAFNTLTAGNAYAIGNQGWHEYVTIGGLKWATMNIGATADTGADSYGTYFAWGSVDKVYTSLSDNTFTFPTTKPSDARYNGNTWEAANGFAPCNDPYINNSKTSYNKYNSSDNKTVLDLADDAAYANWGGPWRMPTGGPATTADFMVLVNACRTEGPFSGEKFEPISQPEEPTTQGVYCVSGRAGLFFVDGSGKKLFFPGAGCGDVRELKWPNGNAIYYSSTAIVTDKKVYYLDFDKEFVFPHRARERGLGFPVRPVSSEFSVKDPFGGSEEEI